MNRKAWLVVLVVLFASACSHYEKNFKPEAVAQEFLPVFQLPGEVAVSGVFPETPNKVKFLAGGGHKWYAYDNELVGAAVMVAKDILSQNKIAINESSPKVLKISLLSSEQDRGWWSTGINFKFQVQAGEAITREFIGSQNVFNAYQAHWAIEAAVTDAMIKAFRDQEILDYLKN